jgi:transcriptional regulator of acetoin/glycerol metabolism
MGRVPDRILCEIIGYVQTFRDVKKMEQRSIVFYFAREGLSPLAIHDDLVTMLGADAVSYSSVIRCLSDAVFASSNLPTALPEREAQFDNCDHAILLALAEQPFASVRELSRLTHLSRTTVHWRLTNSLGFRVRHLR